MPHLRRLLYFQPLCYRHVAPTALSFIHSRSPFVPHLAVTDKLPLPSPHQLLPRHAAALQNALIWADLYLSFSPFFPVSPSPLVPHLAATVELMTLQSNIHAAPTALTLFSSTLLQTLSTYGAFLHSLHVSALILRNSTFYCSAFEIQ